MVDSAADDLLADDRAQDLRAAEPARRFRPSVAHPVRVVQRLQHAKVLRLVRVEGVVTRRRCQVVLVEPGSQRRAELGWVGQVGHPASGLPIACGRPESWSPLRRMNVIARVFSRHPSSVRT